MATLDQNSPITDSPSSAVHSSPERGTDSQPTISKASRKKRDRGGSDENKSSGKTSAPQVAPKSRKFRRTSVSRWNAQKHGILSKAIVLQRPECGERQEDFDALHAEFRKQMKPVGIQEELLVEFMVGACWRYRRALKAEAGLLDQRAGLHGVLTKMKQGVELYEYLHEQMLAVDRTQRPVGSMDPDEISKHDFNFRQRARNNSYCLQDLIGFVDDLIKRVNQNGTLNALECDILKFFFGVENRVVIFLLGALDEAKENNGNACVKDELLALLNRLREIVSGSYDVARLVEKEQIAIATRANQVPDESAMDRILRYQTTLQREFYRAMQQLERLQRMRKGEYVPAPATISFS